MSATATTRPSPQPASWGSPSYVSTTPAGLPPGTPPSAGQITASFLASGAISSRYLAESSSSYFDLVTNPNSSTAPQYHHPSKDREFTLNPLPTNSTQSSKHWVSSSTPDSASYKRQAEPLKLATGWKGSGSVHARQVDNVDDGGSTASPLTASSPRAKNLKCEHRTGGMESVAQLEQCGFPLALKTPSHEHLHMSFTTPPELGYASLKSPSISMSPGGRQHPGWKTTTLPTSKQSMSIAGSHPFSRTDNTPSIVDQDAAKMISGAACADLLKSSSDAMLLLDVRPLPQFTRSRIKGSLNLCIPTTLLKRPSFNLQKVEDTFASDMEKHKFIQWRKCSRIIVYDSSTSHPKDAALLINLLKKFTREGWNGEPSILQGGFSQFSGEFPDYIETHKGLETDNAQGQQQQRRRQPMSISLSLPTAASITGGCLIPEPTAPINPFYSNIRQNVDLVDGVGQIPVQIPSTMTETARQSLPPWLTQVTEAPDNGKKVSNKFLEIEKAEQHRMQEALSDPSSYAKSGLEPQQIYRIAGIEKGSKNRYNNIYPYDHCRVKLQDDSQQSCDYVNASFVQASRSNKTYIATQAPMPSTFNDFWRVVWEQDARLIVMLTAEAEGPQIKCHAYWHSSDYKSLKVKLVSEQRVALGPTQPSNSLARGNSPADDPPYVTLRHLTLSHSSSPLQPPREITQIQYSNWPDFGAPAQPQHLLRLVEECNKLSDSLNNQVSNPDPMAPEPEDRRKVVVHCSAGCGRTGTFCTVDSVIDMLKRQKQTRESKGPTEPEPDWVRQNHVDLVASTVEDFRSQRLSMVQSLRQFVLCYESIVEWLAPETASN